MRNGKQIEIALLTSVFLGVGVGGTSALLMDIITGSNFESKLWPPTVIKGLLTMWRFLLMLCLISSLIAVNIKIYEMYNINWKFIFWGTDDIEVYSSQLLRWASVFWAMVALISSSFFICVSNDFDGVQVLKIAFFSLIALVLSLLFAPCPILAYPLRREVKTTVLRTLRSVWPPEVTFPDFF